MRPRRAPGLIPVAVGLIALLGGGSRAQDAGQPAGFRATAEIVQFDALFVDGQDGTVVALRDVRFQPRPALEGLPNASAASVA